ncbi:MULTISPECIES: hypothetical protein [unclassified Chelatococcus]|uniref:hypothetical protein n=1 Tax=unclassified Chelatococcus TaxID=2638111 RepID=UPI001BD134B4|nr:MULTISPECIES: hypothetical protein [unclassified Chelatococcus]MBS7695644.1 hypothetical protein [Chelatococcus sp. YT9]MBX3557963.1 hypothetical protein [Chelatococcus sp.]
MLLKSIKEVQMCPIDPTELENSEVMGDGFSVARAVKSYLGDAINVSQYVTDPTNVLLAAGQLQEAIDAAASLDRPLIATRAMTVNMGTNMLSIPNGLDFRSFNSDFVISFTGSRIIQETGLSSVKIVGVNFYGAHGDAAGGTNIYNIDLIESSYCYLDVTIDHGNGGVSLDNCNNITLRLTAREMTSAGISVEGEKTSRIILYPYIRNCFGFGVYGTGYAKDVAVYDLRKEYNESTMTQWLLDRRYLDYVGLDDDGITVKQAYFLGLEALGLTYSTSYWTLVNALAQRTADNGFSVTGHHHRIVNATADGPRLAGFSSYGGSNTFVNCTARRCGHTTADGLTPVAGQGFNARSGYGGIARNVAFVACRAEDNLGSDFYLGNSPDTFPWQSGAPAGHSLTYWDDGEGTSYLFYSSSLPGFYGTVSPSAAGWEYDAALPDSQQARWYDGETEWTYRNQFPTGEGPQAFRCVIDRACYSEEAEFVDATPEGSHNIFEPLLSLGNTLEAERGSVTFSDQSILSVSGAGSNTQAVPTMALNRASGSKSSPSNVAGGAYLGTISFNGLVDGEYRTGFRQRALIGDVSPYLTAGVENSFVNPTDGSLVDMIHFTRDGRVGIGDNWVSNIAPQARLDVMGVSAFSLSAARFELQITTVTSNSIEITSRHIALNVSGGATISTLACSLEGRVEVSLRNANSSPIILTHNVNGLRCNSGANITLGQHQAVTFRRINFSGTIWQQM